MLRNSSPRVGTTASPLKAEVLGAVVDGNVAVGHFFGWLAAMTLGNVVGGVMIVGLLNYGQVRAGR
jgi:formate/nitrite transporter FocA (FNT family)